MQQSENKVYINEGNRDVLSLVPSQPGTILDVGCGSGVLASILKSRGHVVDGITISPAEMQAAAAGTRNVYLHNLETGLPREVIDQQYDCVICSHVLEHIVYPEQLLKDIYRVLKPGGRFIIALPNLMHYKSRINLLKGNFKYEDAGIWDFTHVKWYTFSSAQELLLKYGFKISRATVTGELPFNSIFKKILPEQVRKTLFGGLKAISKGFFGYQILIAASKPQA